MRAHVLCAPPGQGGRPHPLDDDFHLPCWLLGPCAWGKASDFPLHVILVDTLTFLFINK